MALQSMTGFGQAEAANSDWTISVEIKSVNHRFKDIRFKIPNLFSPIEIDLKNELTTIFKRGSFDVYINYKRVEGKSKFDDIDDKKVKAFLEKMGPLIADSGYQMDVSPFDFLRTDFLKEMEDSSESVHGLAKEAFSKALISLFESRVTEGIKLIAVIESHREMFKTFFQKIILNADKFQNSIEEKLRKRFSEFSTELNIEEPRFLQEVVYYLEKLDIDEEVNRISAHLDKLGAILSKQTEIGREIDFLMQELNRETNTIGSKSNLKEISEQVVGMKVQLEKIREQGLNLE